MPSLQIGMLVIFFGFSFLRHNQIHDDGRQEYNGNAVFRKDGADNIREDFKHLGHLGEAKADA